ncbi:aconitase X catalytic domain-containing protein [Candidatus Bathyarchaeota archaeon]|nr:aconitase X catalytic domain-containing protein [Candidatus Bathyarchaeota archaeon]
MYLTNEEERILKGEEGYAKQKAMEIVTALGDIYGADRLIPISSAQIAGVSYTSLGDEGIEWLESLRDCHVAVPATLNPASIDLENWRDMGVSSEYACKQLRIINAYRQLGVKPICSCTPYLVGVIPRFGEHIVWSESSAVCYANSVLGARTNREGGPSALASAIVGKTPNYGYHLDENRKATVLINVNVKLETLSDYSTLGYLVGETIGSGVPYFRGLKPLRSEELKALGAGLGTTGSIALYHAEEVTPEYAKVLTGQVERLNFTDRDLREVCDEHFKPVNGSVELVAIGCPHMSLVELEEAAKVLKNRRVRKDRKLWLFTSIAVKRLAERCNLLDIIRRAGGEVYTDCCMALAPLKSLGVKNIAVDSAKAAFYTRLLTRVDVFFGNLKNCIDSITEV